jgi:hypothetical protein
MEHLSELESATRQLHALCVASEIPPFSCVQYDAVADVAAFVWDDSEFGLFVLLADYDLSRMTPDRLRELWDEEEELAVDGFARAEAAVLN